jgi:hypothetical protein
MTRSKHANPLSTQRCPCTCSSLPIIVSGSTPHEDRSRKGAGSYRHPARRQVKFSKSSPCTHPYGREQSDAPPSCCSSRNPPSIPETNPPDFALLDLIHQTFLLFLSALKSCTREGLIAVNPELAWHAFQCTHSWLLSFCHYSRMPHRIRNTPKPGAGSLTLSAPAAM